MFKSLNLVTSENNAILRVKTTFLGNSFSSLYLESNDVVIQISSGLYYATFSTNSKHSM